MAKREKLYDLLMEQLLTYPPPLINIILEYWVDRSQMHFIFMGHSSTGKSTTVGHLLYQTGQITKETIDQYEKESTAMGLGRLTDKYAWVCNKLSAERERGISIEKSQHTLESDGFHLTIIDAPGIRDFQGNMITSLTQTDASVLVVSANKLEFDSGIHSNVGMTYQCALLSQCLGPTPLIVCINKMDEKEVNYSETLYKEIKEKMIKMLKPMGYDTSLISFIPISGWKGDNLKKLSDNMKWYQGPTLLEAMDWMELPSRPKDRPLRLAIEDVYKIGGVGTVPIGRVESGTLKQGMKICFAPSQLSPTECGVIEREHKPLEEAVPGDSIGFNAKNVSVKDIRRGFVVGDPDNDPPGEVMSFDAEVLILQHPGVIRTGYTPVLDIHTAHIACKFHKILAVIDKNEHGETRLLEENPIQLRSGQTAIIEFWPTKPICVEVYTEYPRLGKFTLRDMRTLVGCGKVIRIRRKGRQGYEKIIGEDPMKLIKK